jgi:hypothetical protein
VAIPIKRADSSVKTYACRKATSNSIQYMNSTKKMETGATATDLNIKMSETRLRTMM